MTSKPTPIPYQPEQKRWLGRLFWITGLLIFIGSAVAAVADASIALVVIMFLGGGFLMIRGKRHLTPKAETILARDQRPPVVYLRSFGSETEDYKVGSFFKAFLLNFTKHAPAQGTSTWGPTFQSQLAAIFNQVGPYIAVGRPGQPLPGLGAARLYLGDDEWQDRVRDLLQRTSLMVLRAGTSTGLKWEIETARELLRPQQVLLILPSSKEDYLAFRYLLRDETGIELPEALPRSLLLTFEEDWRPLPLQSGVDLTTTLQPYLLNNGLASR